MRAFEVLQRGRGAVRDVPDPRCGHGEAVVDIAYAGICGTDVGLFDADDERLRELDSPFPLRLGHEWSGTVAAVGSDEDRSWLGRRTTGEPIIGCGRCLDCRAGRPNLCPDRIEVGVRGGRPGALAERLVVPISTLHELPAGIDLAAGAMVEPGANAYRAVVAAGARPGIRLLVLGSGTIGLLCAQFAAAAGAEVHVLGIDAPSLDLARSLGVAATWLAADLPSLRWEAVIDATDGPTIPSFALDVVAPGGTVALIGVAHSASTLDSRRIVRKELAVRGILGATGGFGPAIEAFSTGTVRTRPLIGAIVGLDGVGAVLEGRRPAGHGPGPKLLVEPSR